MTIAARLSPANRTAALARLRQEELDVLVIGGGVVGSGSALDAATRRGNDLLRQFERANQ